MKNNMLVLSMLFFISLQVTFAAIVSDNDGSAFVTKAEFEQLKSDFNSQITNYNDSIDKKIDGAIASYLAGIKLSQKTEQVSLINKINDACSDAYMDNGVLTNYGYRCMAKKYNVPTTQEPKGAVTGAFFHRSWIGATDGSPFMGGWERVGLTYDTRGRIQEIDIPTTGRKNGIYLMMNKYNGSYYLSNELSDIMYKYYISGNSAAHTTNYPPYPSQRLVWTLPEFKDETNTWLINYSDITASWDGTAGSAGYIRCMYGATYEMNATPSVIPVCGKVTGTALGLENSKVKNKKLQSTVYDWSWYPASQLLSWVKDGGTWKGTGDIGVAALSGKFYFNCHPYETITLSDLIDYNATISYGEGKVAIYGGLPLFKATDGGEVTIKITFKSKDNHDVYIGLQKSQFENNETYNIASSLNLRNENDVQYTTNKFSSETEHVLKMDVNKDDVIWIKTYDAESDTTFTGAVTSGIELVS